MTARSPDPRFMREPRCPDCGCDDVALFSDAPDSDDVDHWECGGCGTCCCDRGECEAGRRDTGARELALLDCQLWDNLPESAKQAYRDLEAQR